MQILKLVFLSIVLTFSVVIEAQVKCATIAEIKKQSAGTQIEYTGAAQTTFYNSTYSGLFMEDETGGILLKGYNQSSKNNDKVKDNMSVTGLIGTWEVGDSGKPSGLKIDSKNKRLDKEERDVYRKRTRIILGLYEIIYLAAMLGERTVLCMDISVVVCIVGSLVCLGKINSQEE